MIVLSSVINDLKGSVAILSLVTSYDVFFLTQLPSIKKSNKVSQDLALNRVRCNRVKKLKT